MREHLADSYEVLSSAPELWGFLALPLSRLFVVAGLGGLIAVAYVRQARYSGSPLPKASLWLLATGAIPLLDLLRSMGVAVPVTFLEPLWFSLATGMGVSFLGDCATWSTTFRTSPRWLLAVIAMTLAAGVWWYWQGERYYADYLLGYHDFGHFARRLVNTWEGRGWLMESPGVPAFWDHFNPGLVLLAPLWGIWPDARLFVLLQAICLASPALLVYGIVRRWDGEPWTAAVWSAVYLAYPSVGLLNLSFSYGWHPVSLALPLLFLAVWAMLRGWRIGALIAALLACSFKETVIVALGCLAACLALQAWLDRGERRDERSNAARRLAGNAGLARRLPPWCWLAVWATLVLAFVLIVRLAPFAQFQTARFANLGDSIGEIVLSPWLRPAAFWGQVLRMSSVWFLLAMFVPWHLPNLLRGWPILLAAGLPLGVLLAWKHGPATSIALQYITESIVIMFLAALSGACVESGQATAGPGAPDTGSRFSRSGAMGALAASLTASWLFGSLPWSSPTLSVLEAHSYEVESERDLAFNPRGAGTPGHARLESIVARVDRQEFAVLATGRIAAHLLRVRRLESVEQAMVRWELLQREVGADHSPIEVFDWIVLDRYEQFQQSIGRTHQIIDEARRAGYRETYDQDGLIVFQRPVSTGAEE